MKRPPFAVLLAFAFLHGLLFAASAENPNIVVILTDDQGYADLSSQGIVEDVHTPHIDRLAAEGVRMTDGYITAPQCSPSRAGILSGRYQQRFGYESNAEGMFSRSERSLARRLQEVGYQTCMVGKWHVGAVRVNTDNPEFDYLETHREALGIDKLPDPQDPRNEWLQDIYSHVVPLYKPQARGFDSVFDGRLYDVEYNFDPKGNVYDRLRKRKFEGYRLDLQTEAATAFLDLYHDRPFFLYVSYFAPHVPLEATEEYLARFPGEMPERRRQALAMISAVDDGVGRILAKLAEHGIDENTLIFFLSDNGAPLKRTMADVPILPREVIWQANSKKAKVPWKGAWDGSLNTPLAGEKGMIAEGGIRVPFIMRWKSQLPAGEIYSEPVISLDIAATATAVAGASTDSPPLDGVNLIPFLKGEREGSPHESLYWRFWDQWAIRQGDWKLLIQGNREWLFNLREDIAERNNLLNQHPEKAAKLKEALTAWNETLFFERPIGERKDLPDTTGSFDFYFTEHDHHRWPERSVGRLVHGLVRICLSLAKPPRSQRNLLFG